MIQLVEIKPSYTSPYTTLKLLHFRHEYLRNYEIQINLLQSLRFIDLYISCWFILQTSRFATGVCHSRNCLTLKFVKENLYRLSSYLSLYLSILKIWSWFCQQILMGVYPSPSLFIDVMIVSLRHFAQVWIQFYAGETTSNYWGAA